MSLRHANLGCDARAHGRPGSTQEKIIKTTRPLSSIARALGKPRFFCSQNVRA